MDSFKQNLKNKTSPFLKPIRSNFPHEIDRLVQAGCDINEKDGLLNYPIIYAAYHNAPEAHDRLLSYKPNINVRNKSGETPLMISVYRHQKTLFLKLIQAKANLDLRNLFGQTALMLAVMHENLVAVQELLKAGANLDITDNNNQTAFMHSLNKDSLAIVEAFVKNKPSLVEEQNINENYPFLYCFLTNKKHLIKALLPKNLDTNTPNKKYNGLNLFDYFALRGARSMVLMLIKHGVIIDFRKENIKSIFIQIIDKDEYEMVADFIKSSIAFSGKKGFLLGLSLLKSTLNCHFLFLEYYLVTILKICAKQGYVDIIEELIPEMRYRSDLVAIGELFYIAAKNGHQKIIEHLIEHYSHYITAQDFDDSLNVAVQRQHVTIVSIILKKCYEKISTDEKKSSLFQAVSSGNMDCLNLLLSKKDIEALIPDSAHELFIIAEQKMVHQPALYQPIFDRLMCFPELVIVATKFRDRTHALFHLTSPEKLISGPANKDLFTRELEWITKYTLKTLKPVVFSIEKNDIYVSIENQKINLSKLIEQTELKHIFLNEEDSQYFFKIKKLTQDEFNAIQSPLPAEYILNDYVLTDAERFSIYDYSNYAHKEINDAIYSIPNNELNSSEKIFTVFLQMIFLASGLNKISPKWVREKGNNIPEVGTYRGERHITASEINQRLLNLKQNPNGIVQRNIGFNSTSIHLNIANKFEEGLSRIEFDDCYGKDIQPIALLTEEGEYLQPPGYMHLTDVIQQDSLYIFKAKVVTPLYNKHRSLQQENRFKKLLCLTQSVSLLEDNPFDKLPYPQLADMLDICQYLYDNYLSKPFTDTWFKLDWNLYTLFGNINRPNHGLPHVIRVATFVSLLAPCLMDYDQKQFFNFSQRDIVIVQLTALFSIIGRKSEASYSDPVIDGSGYKAYKKASANAFIEYMLENNFMDMSFEEIQYYANNIRKMGSPKLNTPSGILLTLAHKLDLLRCCASETRINESIINPFSCYLPDKIIAKLLIYSEQLLHATGDRVFYGIHTTNDYNSDIFYRASTNVHFCFSLINEVESPNLETTNIPSLSPKMIR